MNDCGYEIADECLDAKVGGVICYSKSFIKNNTLIANRLAGLLLNA